MSLNFLAPVEITRRLLPLVPDGGLILRVSPIDRRQGLPAGLGLLIRLKARSGRLHQCPAHGNRRTQAPRPERVSGPCPHSLRAEHAERSLSGGAAVAGPFRKHAGAVCGGDSPRDPEAKAHRGGASNGVAAGRRRASSLGDDTQPDDTNPVRRRWQVTCGCQDVTPTSDRGDKIEQASGQPVLATFQRHGEEAPAIRQTIGGALK